MIDEKKHSLNSKAHAALHPLDIHCEVFNDNDFPVILRRMVKTDFGKKVNEYLISQTIPLGPKEIRIPPKDWVYLPHQWYTRHHETDPNRPIRLLINYGDQIGIGNKHPSAPGVRRRLF